MYSIGDKVVYPVHGAGIIEAIEVKKILKEKQSYYIMRIPVGGMLLMIPTANTAEIGIRYIVDEKTANRVVEKFNDSIAELIDNWNQRYRENMKKIRTGNIFEVLEVVKTLMVRDRSKGLSTGERKMLTNSKHILLSELVLAKNCAYDELEQLLNHAVENMSQSI